MCCEKMIFCPVLTEVVVSVMKGDHGNLADVMDHASIKVERRIELAIRGQEREIIQDIQKIIVRNRQWPVRHL
ncbi:MAG: hypothetical protein V1766_11425 [Pseudomonadota bacterium]